MCRTKKALLWAGAIVLCACHQDSLPQPPSSPESEVDAGASAAEHEDRVRHAADERARQREIGREAGTGTGLPPEPVQSVPIH